MKTRKKSHNRVDMTGKVYNYWRVLEPDLERSAGKALYWKAECLQCNKIHSVWGANIRSGLSKRCAGCGNNHGHDLQKGQIRTTRTPLESAYHYLFLELKKSSRNRRKDIDWKLTEAQTISLVTSNCTYCGIKPSMKCQPLKYMGLSQKREEEAIFLRNGIDRIDSSSGYIEGNVVSCCEICNKAKRDLPLKVFTAWIDQIAKFRGYIKS